MSYDMWSELIKRTQDICDATRDAKNLRSVGKILSNVSKDIKDFLEGPLKDTSYACQIKSEFRKAKMEFPFNGGAPIVIARGASDYYNIISKVRNNAQNDGFEFGEKNMTQNNNNQTIHAHTVNNPQNIQINGTAKDFVIKIREKIENSNIDDQDKKEALSGIDKLISFGGNLLY